MSPPCSTGLACLQSGAPLDFKLPLYDRFNDPPQLAFHAPIFALDADEISSFQSEGDEETSLYLLNHWAVDLLLPFGCKPSRVGYVDPRYLAWLLDKAQIALLPSSHLALSLVDELVRLIHSLPRILPRDQGRRPSSEVSSSNWMLVVPLENASEYKERADYELFASMEREAVQPLFAYMRMYLPWSELLSDHKDDIVHALDIAYPALLEFSERFVDDPPSALIKRFFNRLRKLVVELSGAPHRIRRVKGQGGLKDLVFEEYFPEVRYLPWNMDLPVGPHVEEPTTPFPLIRDSLVPYFCLEEMPGQSPIYNPGTPPFSGRSPTPPPIGTPHLTPSPDPAPPPHEFMDFVQSTSGDAVATSSEKGEDTEGEPPRKRQKKVAFAEQHPAHPSSTRARLPREAKGHVKYVSGRRTKKNNKMALDMGEGSSKGRPHIALHTRDAASVEPEVLEAKASKPSVPKKRKHANADPAFPTADRTTRKESSDKETYEDPEVIPDVNTINLLDALNVNLNALGYSCSNCINFNRKCRLDRIMHPCHTCRSKGTPQCSHSDTYKDHMKCINRFERYSRFSNAHLNTAAEHVIRAGDHLQGLHAAVNGAQLELIESSLLLSQLVDKQLKYFGPDALAELHEIPENRHAVYAPLILQGLPYLNNRSAYLVARMRNLDQYKLNEADKASCDAFLADLAVYFSHDGDQDSNEGPSGDRSDSESASVDRPLVNFIKALILAPVRLDIDFDKRTKAAPSHSCHDWRSTIPLESAMRFLSNDGTFLSLIALKPITVVDPLFHDNYSLFPILEVHPDVLPNGLTASQYLRMCQYRNSLILSGGPDLMNTIRQFYADLRLSFLLFSARLGSDEKVQIAGITNIVNTLVDSPALTALALLTISLHAPTRLNRLINERILLQNRPFIGLIQSLSRKMASFSGLERCINVSPHVFPDRFHVVIVSSVFQGSTPLHFLSNTSFNASQQTTPRLSIAQKETLINIGKSVRATKYDSFLEQCAFLDEKTEALDAFSPFMAEIAEDTNLYPLAFALKNPYNQTTTSGTIPIGGSYPVIVDFCNRLKVESVRAKNNVLLAQQVHRAELEDVRAAKEAQDNEVRIAKEAARTSKDDAKKKAKAKKTKSKSAEVTVDDIDDDISFIGDSESTTFAASGETDNHMHVDLTEPISLPNPLPIPTQFVMPASVTAATATPVRDPSVLVDTVDRVSRLIDSFRSRPRRADESAQRGVAEEFQPPSTRKRPWASSQFAHEDSEEQFTAADLSVNNDRIKQTVATAHSALNSSPIGASIGSLRLEESDLRSRIAFANAQLQYQLNHREYLLQDLKRVMDAQHQRMGTV
ncbi:hypothetical protein B0H17DRAFT_1144432 [Mycena rosella]|uniref:Zn(2)-C6 fungal-type domain-containing protein n=1 Tax=Mycena rosella TaxID=1033263 RepID=A0AAD7CTB9_MYCRO|nr:hypothetical protein B0H17DRAFT_1144432 [Mycena rosella]